MKVKTNMAESIIKDVNRLDATLPGIKEQLERNVTELLDNNSVIGIEEVQEISRRFDGVLGLVQNYDGTLLSFIRSASKTGTISQELLDKVREARQSVLDMEDEVTWSRERLVTQVNIHNAGLGCFTFLTAGTDAGKSDPSPGEDIGLKSEEACGLVPEEACKATSEEASRPMTEEVL